jgi:uncharacterized protein (PEP-CTERM system associated)
MAIMVMDTAPNKTILAVAILAILSVKSFAGEWQFQPHLIIDETHSNNVNLSLNEEESSLVSQAGIELEALYASKKLEFNLSSTSVYAMYSHDHDIDNDFHTLDSSFRLKLAPKGLALTGSAAISNQSRNSSRNALADIVSGDTVRIERYSSGLEYGVNNSDFRLNSSIEYRTTKAEDNIGEREGYAAQLVSQNGKSARNIYWDTSVEFASYSNQGRDGEIFKGEIKIGLITHYSFTPFLRYYDENNEGDLNNNNTSIESNSYGAGLRWLISPRIFLDLSYNTPTGIQFDFDGKKQEDYAAASVRWEPSQRTQLKMEYGQRFYGESYGLDFSHKNKRLTNKIAYSEDVKTFTRNNYESVVLGSYWCPQGEILDTASCFISNNENLNFDDFQLITLSDLVLVEDQNLSLNKALTWTSTLELSRTTFSFSLSNLDRENLSTRVKDKDKRATFSIARKVSGKSTLTLNLGYNDNHFAIGQTSERQDRYRRYSLEYDKSLNSRLTVKLGLSHLNRSSTTQALNYEEGRVYFKISKGF